MTNEEVNDFCESLKLNKVSEDQHNLIESAKHLVDKEDSKSVNWKDGVTQYAVMIVVDVVVSTQDEDLGAKTKYFVCRNVSINKVPG